MFITSVVATGDKLFTSVHAAGDKKFHTGDKICRWWQ